MTKIQAASMTAVQRRRKLYSNPSCSCAPSSGGEGWDEGERWSLVNTSASEVIYNLERSHPGLLVVMPSTLAAMSCFAFAGESTVQM